QTSDFGISDSSSSRSLNDVRPWCDHVDRWVGDGSRAQCLVGRCADGDRHPRRLDDAGQEPVLLVPATRVRSRVFSQAASLSRTFLRVRGYFARPRRLPDLWRIQVKITLASVATRSESKS